ncbi:MAG: prepilin-type N-terminal cleavage/methylation domain-containing protein [Candidatus Omnitrophica bacterium]|nr:prepilin-type N-terminal cleavage/methylation domain-containing protein [Candidatus Omnitrophota bacterium]
MGHTFSGFTLIELLIVVAIIGILAAIAVPNFLNAQVRAKVSRAHADMRSLATSIEAYRVSHNTYPPDGDDLPNFNPTDFDTAARLRPLTTPVSYITSLPHDPFHTSYIEFPPETGIQLLFPGNPPHTYIYTTYGSHTGDARQPPNFGKPDNYGLSSLGPNQIFNAFIGYPVIYDSSNGLTSDGDITIVGGQRTPLSP